MFRLGVPDVEQSFVVSDFGKKKLGRINFMRVSLKRTSEFWSFVSKVPVFETVQVWEIQKFNVCVQNLTSYLGLSVSCDTAWSYTCAPRVNL